MNRRSILLGAAAMGVAGAACARPAGAQAAYPNRPIRMIVPWPPGQATDLIGRVVGQRVSEQIGQPIVPENRAGAGGMIGTDAAAKAAPDGYTVLMGSTGPITTAPLVQRTPYDPDRDFAPVAMFGVNAYLLTVTNNFPARDMAEFVARLRAEPGKYTYATSGAGAAAHLITADVAEPAQGRTRCTCRSRAAARRSAPWSAGRWISPWTPWPRPGRWCGRARSGRSAFR